MNKKKPMKHLTPLLTVLCVIRLHSAIVLNYWDQRVDNYSKLAQPSSLSSYSLNQGSGVCVSHWAAGESTFSLSNSNSFKMSSHLDVTVSHLLFTVIPHPRFSTLQGIETVIYMLNILTLRIQCKVNSLSDINYSQCTLLVTTYLSTADNFYQLQCMRVEKKNLQTNEFGSYNIT